MRYSTTPQAIETILNHRATEKSPRACSEAKTLAKATTLPRGLVVAVLKELGGRGMGRFILGRKGAPTRLEWLPARDPAKGKPRAATTPPPASPPVIIMGNMTHISHTLRGGEEVGHTFLPDDITPEELMAVAELVFDAACRAERHQIIAAKVTPIRRAG